VERSLRTRIAGGEVLVGTVLATRDPGIAELTGSCADFVWIDLEHGSIGRADVLPLAIAAQAGGAAALVRLEDPSGGGVGAALDAGADGVVVPHVESAAAAGAVAERLRYPPRGSRGVAARRATRYGLAPDAAEPLCFVQIESMRAVEAAGAIAAVDGVDALVVGCTDLAAALGDPPGTASATLRGAVAHVQSAADDAGVASGVAGPDDPELLCELAAGRSTLVVVGADVRILARALDSRLRAVSALLARNAPERKETHVGT
jgi:2-keto-3-deoxy-L-rhamnonate aldolase RhmA